MTEAFKPLTLQDLLHLEIPEPSWLVDGLIQDGRLALLAAREKSGKGLLPIDLVASVAEGSEFLGRATAQGTAIYCATEETLTEVQSRVFNRVGEPEELPPVMVLPLDGSMGATLDITRPESVARLEAMVNEHQPRLMVIDVLREIHDLKEDSSDDMAPILKVVRNLSNRTGTAIVLNHHMSKGGQARGSTAISGGVDVMMELHTPESDGDGTSLGGMLTVKGRSVPKQRLRISFGDGARWTATGDGPPMTGRVPAKNRIRNLLLESADPLSVKEIAASLGISDRTVNNELGWMKAQNPPWVDPEPSGRQGGAILYRAFPEVGHASPGA